jgi:hypothetical protein
MVVCDAVLKIREKHSRQCDDGKGRRQQDEVGER